MKTSFKMLLALVFLLSVNVRFAVADVTFNLVEVGNDIQISVFGSIDLGSTLGFDGMTVISYSFNARSGADRTFVGVFPTESDRYLHSGLVVSGDWSPLNFDFEADLVGDSSQGIFVNESDSSGFESLFLPIGYLSNDPLDFSVTILNRSFADSGFSDGNTGSVSWSNNGITESITFNWGNTVPEPVGSIFLGFGVLFALKRRRQ